MFHDVSGSEIRLHLQVEENLKHKIIGTIQVSRNNHRKANTYNYVNNVKNKLLKNIHKSQALTRQHDYTMN